MPLEHYLRIVRRQRVPGVNSALETGHQGWLESAGVLDLLLLALLGLLNLLQFFRLGLQALVIKSVSDILIRLMPILSLSRLFHRFFKSRAQVQLNSPGHLPRLPLLLDGALRLRPGQAVLFHELMGPDFEGYALAEGVMLVQSFVDRFILSFVLGQQLGQGVDAGF